MRPITDRVEYAMQKAYQQAVILTLIQPSSEPDTKREESAVQKSTLQMRLSCASYSLTARPVSTSHSVTQPS